MILELGDAAVGCVGSHGRMKGVFVHNVLRDVGLENCGGYELKEAKMNNLIARYGGMLTGSRVNQPPRLTLRGVEIHTEQRSSQAYP